jgi:probable F420-dependent oxidoreductase
VVATGIAGIYSRDAMTTAAAQKTLAEAYPDRFLLGLGVSHQVMVEAIRGNDYAKPYSAMRDHLDRMDGALFLAAPPTAPPKRVLAALRPRMWQLAAERADGALTYFVPPEHTASARDVLGPDRLLCVEQAVVFETDRARAHEIARTHTRTYTPLPNYTNNLRRFGFDDDDFADAGSDRLVDAIVAWGDMEAILAHIQAHHDAGADHVCIQVIDGGTAPPVAAWRALAHAL